MASHYNLTGAPEQTGVERYDRTDRDLLPVFTSDGYSGKWSGSKFSAPPAIGTRVKVNFNELGYGTVTGYFVEGEWFGVQLKPEAPPAWWVKQNKGKDVTVYHVFGAEIVPA